MIYPCCIHCDHDVTDAPHDDACDAPGCPAVVPIESGDGS